MRTKHNRYPGVTSNFSIVIPNLGGELNCVSIGELSQVIKTVTLPDGGKISAGEIEAGTTEIVFVLNKRDPILKRLYIWREKAIACVDYLYPCTVHYLEGSDDPTQSIEIEEVFPESDAFPAGDRNNPEVAMYKMSLSYYNITPSFP